MKKPGYQRRTCRLCGHKSLQQVLHLEPIPLPDEYIPKTKLHIPQPCYPLDLVLCDYCGHVQTREVIYPEVIYKNYIYETTSSLGLVDHFVEYAHDSIKKLKPHQSSLVVDIGSNDGTLLKAYQDKGMRVLGVDPAVEIARDATHRGIETLPQFFTPKLAKQVVKKYGRATIITANNLYANIDNLDELTLGVKQLLTPDGVFIIESFYLLDVMKHMVFDFFYHEHLSCFTVKPMQAYFKKHGMELFDIVHVSTKGGSLRYMIQLAGGPRKVSKTVKKYLKLESRYGVHTKKAFRKFEKRIVKAKRAVWKLVGDLKAHGKRLAGYGASATSTTLIYHFELQKIFDYLVDDYTRKQNTFSPGCHIPVLSKSEMLQKRPDYIIVLAWRYAEVIIKKNQEYLDRGGKFIIPLPKLKIISK